MNSSLEFFEYINYAGNQETYFLVVMIMFSFFSRETSFYLAFAITISLALSITLKLMLRDPRPYMVTDEITNYICILTFANPASES